MILATGLDFDVIRDYSDELTVDAVGDMIFNYKYQTGAATGFASDRFKSAAFQAGMTQKFFEMRGMNKFEIMEYLDSFENFTSKDARLVLDLVKLAKGANTTDQKLFATIAERDTTAFANTGTAD